MNGNGYFRLPENARIVVLPFCHHCRKDAPYCRCGIPAKRPTA